MEKPDKQHVPTNDNPGTWVMITVGPVRLIGRVCRLKTGDVTEVIANEAAVDAVLEAEWVSLKPTLDFFAPLRPVPRLGEDNKPMRGPDGQAVLSMVRDPIITTRDFTLKPYPTHVRMGPGVIIDFVSQMAETDQQTYKNFIGQAIGKAMQEGVAKAGIHMPTGDEVVRHGRS